jgi:predicted DNA-binding transcriptional regulator AlpA
MDRKRTRPGITVAGEPPSDTPALLTLAMIRQRYFPAGERTLFRLISSGRFPTADIRMGGKLRFWKRETVENWIAQTSTN